VNQKNGTIFGTIPHGINDRNLHIQNAMRVNKLFLNFESAQELRTLNEDNIFMGQLFEVEENRFLK